MRKGFSLIETVLVLVLIGIMFRIALPRLQLSRFRADAGAQQLRSALQTAQRMSITRQHDVIVSVDTVRQSIRIVDDGNNSGQADVGEAVLWRGMGDGNRFAVPPLGLAGAVKASVDGPLLKSVDGYPTIVFHRDGSASTDAEVYLSSGYRSRVDYRLVTVSRSTGRTELYRLSGTGSTPQWLPTTP